MVADLVNRHEVSERRACEVLGQHRTTQRHVPRRPDDQAKLVAAMLALVSKHPRFGYRRICMLLRRQGWKVNRKRIYRLWKANGLKVPVVRRKRRRVGHDGNACNKRKSLGKDDVWAWDFIEDSTTKGVKLRWLSVIDEYTRECVVLQVATSMGAQAVIEMLSRAVQMRGRPRYVRSDNGPEFIAKAIQEWLTSAGVGGLYIEPGAPWQNGYAESFHSRVRDEFLNMEQFTSITEARVLTAAWKEAYNRERPQKALGELTPLEYGDKCERYDSPKPTPNRSHDGSG